MRDDIPAFRFGHRILPSRNPLIKLNPMRQGFLIAIFGSLASIAGCSSHVSFLAVDAQTGKPLESVQVDRTRTVARLPILGFTNTETETMGTTDSSGRIMNLPYRSGDLVTFHHRGYWAEVRMGINRVNFIKEVPRAKFMEALVLGPDYRDTGAVDFRDGEIVTIPIPHEGLPDSRPASASPNF
jgi:hypothetical protein